MDEDGSLEETLSRRKELKVQVPRELYLRLHQHKILNGQLLSDVVSQALANYLEEALDAGDDTSD